MTDALTGHRVLLMAAGLVGLQQRLIVNATRSGRIGLVLALIGLVIPALANLAALAVWPPLLGVALILIARGQHEHPGVGRLDRPVLVGMGLTQLFVFLWSLLVRPDVLDQIDGYRICGMGANVLFGIGWILLGISILNSTNAAEAGRT